MLRVYGVSESAVARALAEAGGEPEGVQATICAHAGEIWIELFGDGRGAGGRASAARSVRSIFAEDDRPVEELVLDLARARGLSLAAAESCTGGLVAARLTSVPGSSDVFRGGVVAYDNGVKHARLGVSEETLAAHGAVSAETASAMALGAQRVARRGRRRLRDGHRRARQEERPRSRSGSSTCMRPAAEPSWPAS